MKEKGQRERLPSPRKGAEAAREARARLNFLNKEGPEEAPLIIYEEREEQSSSLAPPRERRNKDKARKNKKEEAYYYYYYKL